MISAARAVPVIVLCGLALVPVSIHTYAGLQIDDGLRTSTLPEAVDGFRSVPGSADRPWGTVFASSDWLERRYSGSNGGAVLTVIRTFDLKRAYHHPELAVAHASGFTSYQVTTVDGVPLHVLASATTGKTAVYALHYDGGFVASPLRFQLGAAIGQLIGGRRPMTLVFAKDEPAVGNRPATTWPSTRVVLSIAAALPR